MRQLKLFFLLSVFICMAVINASAQDGSNIEIDGIYYRLSGDAYSYDRAAIVVNPNANEWIYSSSSYEGSITIPSSITIKNEGADSWDNVETTYPVTAIDPGAFRGCDNLTSISIPGSVKAIGDGAFADCSNLANVTVPSDFVFSEKAIGNMFGFWVDISLTDTKWYKSQPDGMVYLGKVAYKCKGMSNIASHSISIKQGTERIASTCFAGPGCWSLKTIDIPNSVTSIGAYAFSDGSSYICNGSAITIPSSVKSIEPYAFANCSFSSLTLPESLEEIGASAFEDCSGLSDIIIPDKVKVFYVSSFSGCRLSSLTIGKGVRCILRRNSNYTDLLSQGYDYVYDDMQQHDREDYDVSSWYLTDINTIEHYYEKDYSSEDYYLKRKGLDVKTIKVADGNEVFDSRNNCNAVINTSTNTLVLGSANTTIPSSVTAIGWNAFKDCSITTLAIPSSVESIDIEAFRGSMLTSITIPSSVSKIGVCVLANCTNLASVKLEEGVSAIDDCAFAYSTSMITLTTPSSLTQIGSNAFTGTALMSSQLGEVIYVGSIAVGFSGEMPANHSIIIKEGTRSIAGNAFSNQVNMTSIHIPNTVKGIGKSAFEGCTGLTSLSVPASVENVGQSAFYGCSNLGSVELYCKEVGDGWFSYEKNLSKVTFGYGVEKIGESAFSNCANLEVIVIPSSVKIVGSGAFYGTTWYNAQSDGLIYVGKAAYKYKGSMPDNTEIFLNDGTKSISSSAFYGCSGLSNIVLPESIEAIGSYAFYGCSNLEAISIPVNVNTLGYNIFSGCSSLATAEAHCNDFGSLLSISSLKTVIIGKEVTTLNDNAFSSCSKLVSVTVDKASPLSISRYTFYSRKNAILYVPYGSRVAYETAEYWKDFKEIVEMEEPSNNTLFAADREALVGTKIVLPIELTNTDEAKLCQFDLRLPAGITVATKTNGKLDAKLTERAENHSISSQKLSNGDYRFIISSLDNDSFTGNNGTLINVTLDISATMEAGEHIVKVLNVELSVPNGTDLDVVKPADTESKLTVKDYTPGDVNNDGSVSVTDVGCAINYILEQVPSVFIFDAADMNRDKSISVTDVGMIINLILNEGAASRSRVQQIINDANLSLVPTADGYQLKLDNKDAFISFQMDVQLADGADINRINLNDDNDHKLKYRKLDNGSYRLVCYSLSNSAFIADDAALLTIPTTGDIVISDIRLTTVRLNELRPIALRGTSTGIANIENGIQVSVQGHTLQITSDSETTINLYSLSGSIIRVLNLHRGVNCFDDLRAGIYMIGNRKVIIR